MATAAGSRRLIGGRAEQCRAEGFLEAENALRGQWRMRCSKSDLRVSITLSPTAPARVQALDVTPLGRDEALGRAPVCR